MRTQTPIHSTLGAIALLTMAGGPVQGQTWVNVSDPAYGSIAGSSSELGTDTAGNLYAVGSTQQTTDGNMRAVVRGSGDQGSTWSVLDQYAEPGLNYAHNRAFAANPLTGSLFAGGNLNNLLPDGTWEFDTLWFIREWSPITGVWATVDDFADLANDIGQASCADIMVSPSGDVYATGGSALGAGPGWLVRKRPAGAAAFTTVDVSAITVDAAGHLFVGGQASDSAGKLWWLVRKGVPGTKRVKQGGKWVTVPNVTWTNSDLYQLVAGQSARANGLTVDSIGAVFASGWAADATGEHYWIVRRLAP